ncbi:MAG: hypothetical protein E7052_05975 [Lentisphaerae bacterium]|nr:hypothetical protein [Lentisphaerota bacterium]
MEKNRKTASCSCRECEMAIVAGSVQENPAVQVHLDACPACREFADFQQLMLKSLPADDCVLPEFSEICSAVKNRHQQQRKRLKFWLYPLSAAAAAAIFAGGIYLNLPSSPINSYKNNYAAAELQWFDESTLNTLLEENSVKMTWDQTSSKENQCIDSMRAARSGSDQWSIELSNFYSEDWL